MGRPFELAIEAVKVLEDYVRTGVTFSAYTITSVLRTPNPGQDIPHREVRAAVHAAMVGHIVSGKYDSEIQAFPEGMAIVYYPFGTTPQPFYVTPKPDPDPLSSLLTPPVKTLATPPPTPTVKPPRRMRMLSISSSCFSHVGYDVDSKTLRVEFHGGRVYDYPNVAADVFAGLVTAQSAGQYYNAYVRLLEHQPPPK